MAPDSESDKLSGTHTATIRIPRGVEIPYSGGETAVLAFGLEGRASATLERMLATISKLGRVYALITPESKQAPRLCLVNGGSRTAIRRHKAAAQSRRDIANCPIVYLGGFKAPPDAEFVVPTPVAPETLRETMEAALASVAKATTQSTPTDTCDPLEDLSILVGDAALPLRVQLEKILDQRTQKMTFANSCKEIVACLQRESFSLVLLKCEYPDGSGLELCRTIREASATSAQPIALLSSSSQLVDGREAHQVGANGVIRRPIDALALQRLLIDTGVATRGGGSVAMNATQIAQSTPQLASIDHSPIRATTPRVRRSGHDRR